MAPLSMQQWKRKMQMQLSALKTGDFNDNVCMCSVNKGRHWLLLGSVRHSTTVKEEGEKGKGGDSDKTAFSNSNSNGDELSIYGRIKRFRAEWQEMSAAMKAEPDAPGQVRQCGTNTWWSREVYSSAVL